MGTEIDIIIGFSVMSALFAYYSSELGAQASLLPDDDRFFISIAAQSFFSLSILFILLIMNLLLAIVNNDATITYLQAPIVLVAFQVIYYFLMIGGCLYILSIIVGCIKLMSNAVSEKFGRAPQRKKSTPEREQ